MKLAVFFAWFIAFSVVLAWAAFECGKAKFQAYIQHGTRPDLDQVCQRITDAGAFAVLLAVALFITGALKISTLVMQ